MKKKVFATCFEELLYQLQALVEEFLHEKLQGQEEEEDVGEVIISNEVRKVTCVCELTSKLLKEGGPTLEIWLTQVFNKVWNAENVQVD